LAFGIYFAFRYSDFEFPIRRTGYFPKTSTSMKWFMSEPVLPLE
jgi:hypothetical protein